MPNTSMSKIWGFIVLKKVLSVIGAYKVYEKWLWYQVKNGVRPEHIAIILDGNRRWANEQEDNPWLSDNGVTSKAQKQLSSF